MTMNALSGYPLRAMREAERGDEGAVLRRCIDSLAAAMRRYGQCAEAHAEGISQQVRSNQPNVSTSSSRLISISKFFSTKFLLYSPKLTQKLDFSFKISIRDYFMSNSGLKP